MPTRRMHSDSVPYVNRTSHHPGCIFQSSRGQPPRPSGFVQFILCVVRRTCCGSRLAILARHIRSYPFSVKGKSSSLCRTVGKTDDGVPLGC